MTGVCGFDRDDRPFSPILLAFPIGETFEQSSRRKGKHSIILSVRVICSIQCDQRDCFVWIRVPVLSFLTSLANLNVGVIDLHGKRQVRNEEEEEEAQKAHLGSMLAECG